MKELIRSLTWIPHLHSHILINACTLNTFYKPLAPPFVSDLRKFKEAKKQFDKVSEEKEAALIKNAQAPRNKQHEVEEATNILTATRKCFRHIVLDYVLQVQQLAQGFRL